MNTGEILIHQNPEGNIKIDVRLEEETVWLAQELMALLFGKARNTITKHSQNVLQEGELNQEVVCRDFRHTTQHGAIQGKTSAAARTILTEGNSFAWWYKLSAVSRF